MSKIGDYVKIRTGKLDANASSEDGEYPFFTCSKEPLKIDTYSYDCECVLVAGNGDLNVKYYNGKFDAYQRTYILESLDKTKLSVQYMYLFLDSYLDTLRNQSIGGVIKYIKLGNLQDAEIKLPPLEKQKQIASELDKITDLITKRKSQLEKLDLLIKSKFNEMFGDVGINNKQFMYSTIGETCWSVKDGPHVSPKYSQDGIPFISVRNIMKGKIDLSDAKYITYDKYVEYTKKCKPEYGDLLYSKGGTTGIAKRVDVQYPFCNWVHLAVLKFNNELLNDCFFEVMLNSSYCYMQSQQLTKGIANRDLVLSAMKLIKIFLPPIELQNQFANYVQKIEKTKEKMQAGLESLETLYKSRMQEYFG